MGALIISKRLFGFTTNSVKQVDPEDTFDATAITCLRVFDCILDNFINEVEQVVLPGVGFDLIAFNYLDNENIKIFELDQKNTLKMKVETSKKAGIEHNSISFIPVDYENESWSNKLLEAGFDKTKKNFVYMAKCIAFFRA